MNFQFGLKFFRAMGKKLKTYNPWNKDLQWYGTRHGNAVIVFIFVIVIYVIFWYNELQVISFNLKHDCFSPNATISITNAAAANFSKFVNTTGILDCSVAKYYSRLMYEYIPNMIYLVIFSFFGSMIILAPFYIYRRFNKYGYSRALVKHCQMPPKLTRDLLVDRRGYKKNNSGEQRSSLIEKEEFGIHAVTDENFRKKELSGTFSDFMFERILPVTDEGYQFFTLQKIIGIHDLLRAVDDMHGKGIFHLDLQPGTVRLQWYVFRRDLKSRLFMDADVHKWNDNKLTRSSYALSTGFEIVLPNVFPAVRSVNGTVSSGAVGSSDFYRPPECFKFMEVEAGKVDSWGIGVMAFEMLTGGMLTIEGEAQNPPAARVESVVTRVMNKEYFSSAFDASHKIVIEFLKRRYLHSGDHIYMFDQTEFVSDCFDFVKGLLQPDPNARWSVDQALNSKLMKKTVPGLRLNIS